MSKRRSVKRTSAEWVAFGIASAILAALMVTLLALWITGEDRPPAFTVKQTSVEQSGDNYYLTVSVKNTGDRTAAEVNVAAELTTSSAGPEEGEQTIDFLSGGETEEVAFVFSADPEAGELTLAVAGYNVP